MKAVGTRMLTAMLGIVLFAGCQKKDETVAQAPVQEAPPPKFPEEQVPKAEPQPTAAASPQPTPAPQPVDTTANATPEPAPPRAHRQMPKESYARPEKKAARTYVVKKGDTLQEISQKMYGSTKNWRKIYQANKKMIGGDPNKLTEGQKLVIP